MISATSELSNAWLMLLGSLITHIARPLAPHADTMIYIVNKRANLTYSTFDQ